MRFESCELISESIFTDGLSFVFNFTFNLAFTTIAVTCYYITTYILQYQENRVCLVSSS